VQLEDAHAKLVAQVDQLADGPKLTAYPKLNRFNPVRSETQHAPFHQSGQLIAPKGKPANLGDHLYRCARDEVCHLGR
jgi:hypothetical protein